MVIIKLYSLERKENSNLVYVRSQEECSCPYCDGSFKVIGSRKRGLYRLDNTIDYLIIRRLRCEKCSKISHELPDIVIPYKRYEADAIAEVLDESAEPEDTCCPAELSTIQKWKCWFFLLGKFLEAFIRTSMEAIDVRSVVQLPLYPLSRQPVGWLKALVRFLVNSGYWGQTRCA